MILVEGVGAVIDPNINLWKLAEPWIEKWALTNITLEAKLVELAKHLPDLLAKYIEKSLKKS